jgi:hypothetical protein
MPSPVGHILGGTVLFLAGKKAEFRSKTILFIILLGSIFPDLDFLPGILIGNLRAFHHGISHSLAFAVLFGALVFLVVRRMKTNIALEAGVFGALAYGLHIVLDFISVNEGTRGVPIFWPLSDKSYGLDLGLFGYFHYGPLERGIWTVVRWDNVPALTRELIGLGIPVLLLLARRWRSRCNRVEGLIKEHKHEC